MHSWNKSINFRVQAFARHAKQTFQLSIIHKIKRIIENHYFCQFEVVCEILSLPKRCYLTKQGAYLSIYQHFVHFSNCIQLCIILIMQQSYFFFFLAFFDTSWLSKSIFLTLFSLFRNSFKFHIMTAVWLSWNANIL